MQSAARIAVSMVLLTSAVASAYHNSAKLRRDGVLNLYPFPRVGRASHKTWQVPVDDYNLEYESKLGRIPHRTWQLPLTDFNMDYEPMEKRQLYAFPRVGRAVRKRSDSTGMWFGPRLGRALADDDEIPRQSEPENERSEPEQPESSVERRKRGAGPL